MRKLINTLYGLSIVLLINAPSIKIFIPTEVVNLSATIGIWLFGVLLIIATRNNEYKQCEDSLGGRRVLLYACLFSILFVLLLASVFYGGFSQFDLYGFFRYLAVYVGTMGALLLSKRENTGVVHIMQILWGCFLTFLILTRGPDVYRNTGNYLMVGVPIAASLTISGVSFIIQKKQSLKLYYVAVSLVLLYGLVALSGRSPLIFSLLIIVLVALLKSLQKGSPLNTIKSFSFFLVTTYCALYFIYTNLLPERWIQRFQRMLYMVEAESRTTLYSDTLKLFYERPWGYGLESFSKFTGWGYPHNIFLEIIFSGGILAILVFIAKMIIVADIWFKAITKHTEPHVVLLAVMSMYLFFAWNTSFNLASAYVPFVSIAITVAAYCDTGSRG